MNDQEFRAGLQRFNNGVHLGVADAFLLEQELRRRVAQPNPLVAQRASAAQLAEWKRVLAALVRPGRV